LEHFKKIEEKNYFKLINKYHEEINAVEFQRSSKNFIKSIGKEKFDENNK